jgi:hypothetical protein
MIFMSLFLFGPMWLFDHPYFGGRTFALAAGSGVALIIMGSWIGCSSPRKRP